MGGVWLSNGRFFSDNVGCSGEESSEAPKQVGVRDANSEMLGLGAGTMARVGLRCGEEFEDVTCAVNDEWPESVGIGVSVFMRTVLSKAKPLSRGTALKVSRPSQGSGICPSQGGCLKFALMGAHKTTQKKTYQFIVLGKGSQKPLVTLCNDVMCQKKTFLRKYQVLDRVDSENPIGNKICLACDGQIDTYKVTCDMHSTTQQLALQLPLFFCQR